MTELDPNVVSCAKRFLSRLLANRHVRPDLPSEQTALQECMRRGYVLHHIPLDKWELTDKGRLVAEDEAVF